MSNAERSLNEGATWQVGLQALDLVDIRVLPGFLPSSVSDDDGARLVRDARRLIQREPADLRERS